MRREEEAHTSSCLATEHFDLDRATCRNTLTNPGDSGFVGINFQIAPDDGEVDVEEFYFKMLLDQLRGAVSTGHGGSIQPPTIYAVPEELRNLDHNYRHEPISVLLGPFYHHGNSGTQRLEKYKWCCARQLISRHSCLLEPARTPVLLDQCCTSIKRLLPRIRASYCEEINSRTLCNDDHVVEMMLKDGCFILHRLLKYARCAKMEADGGSDQFDNDEDWTQVYGRCFVWQFVTRDLLLLENQIPFFVIRELFQQLRNEDESEELLVTGSLKLFRSLRPQMLHRKAIACDDVHHLLHLFHLSIGLPPTDRQQHSRHHQSDDLLSELPQWIPSVKELKEAGIRFRKRKNATSFLDIKFSCGVLEIPQLELDDFSESLFLNQIAFEQTYPDTARDVSTYVVFMNCLVTSPEDMRILGLQGILVDHLNSRRASHPAWRFFSNIVAQVHWSADNYLVSLMGAVNGYRDSKRHKWRAALARNYFTNPWVTMSVFAALLLLAMAMLQTFFTVYRYFKPPK